MSSHSEEPARQLSANPDSQLPQKIRPGTSLVKSGQAESLARALFQIAREYGFAS